MRPIRLEVDQTSIARVLDRSHANKESPIPPFEAIRQGFEGVRGNRLETIIAIAEDPTASYRLISNGEVIAEIKPIAKGESMPADPLTRLEIHDEKRFNGMIPSPEEVSAQAATNGDQVITQDAIDKLCGQYGEKLRPKLEPHMGKTWKAAVDSWSNDPPQTAPQTAQNDEKPAKTPPVL